MSFLTDTAASSVETGGVQGAGMTGVDPITGAGYSGVNPTGAALNDPTNNPGLMAKMGALLQDPEVQKALGDAMKHVGNLSAAVKKMPPEIQQMAQHVLSGAGAKHRPSTNPYLGDAANYLTPEVAQQTMRTLGIPSGSGGY